MPSKALDNGAFHQWSQNEIDALHLALAAGAAAAGAGRTGDRQDATGAGCGGGAEVASAVRDRQPALRGVRICSTVSTPCSRLADAQAARLLAAASRTKAYYWLPGPFWRAFDWEARKALRTCRCTRRAASIGTPTEATPPGHVILIDEIDKADSDLPNSLLEVLGSREFRQPGDRASRSGRPRLLPLVVITTNEERELPAAFLRRCVVLTLEPDESYAASSSSAGARTSARKPGGRRAIALDDEILQIAAEQLADDRHNAKAAGVPPPGLAEYIDLLTALRELAPGNCDEQVAWLKRLVRYAFLKNGVVEDNPRSRRIRR
jgi:hypothetical protein